MFRMHLLPVFAVLVAVCSASAREQNIVAINIVQAPAVLQPQAIASTALDDPISTDDPTKFIREWPVNKYVTPSQMYLEPLEGSARYPTSAWWQQFMLPDGQGFYQVTVVQDGSVTDATKEISKSEAESLGYSTPVGESMALARDIFEPNTFQGCYYMLNSPFGVRFSNQEVLTNSSDSFRALREWSFMLGAAESMEWNMASGPPAGGKWPRRAVAWDDDSVVMRYTATGGEGQMDAYLVRFSPYVTVHYDGTITPLLSTVGQSFIANVIVEDGKRTSERAVSYTGTRFLVEMTDGSKWKVYCSKTITFSIQTVTNYVVIPDDEPMPGNSNNYFYIRLSEAGFLNQPDGPELGFEYQYISPHPDELKYNALMSDSPFEGVVRVAKIPKNSRGSEEVLDESANVIPKSVRAAVVQFEGDDDDDNSYGVSYVYESVDTDLQPTSDAPLLTILEPFVSNADAKVGAAAYETVRGASYFAIPSTANGKPEMQYQFAELPAVSFFDKGVTIAAGQNGLTQDDVDTLLAQLSWELDFINVTNFVSSYTGGKQLQALAEVCLFTAKAMEDQGESSTDIYNAIEPALTRLKSYMTKWLGTWHFVYDGSWGGTLCTSGLVGTTFDYGNVLYQDHQFHYGYYIHAAAMVAALDNTYLPASETPWVDEVLNSGGSGSGTMQDMVNLLIRDVSNPSDKDEYYPRWRMTDWGEGHQRAMGMYATGSGGNEESTAEDINYWFGMMMWGDAIGNEQMTAIGRVMSAFMGESGAAFWQVGSTTSVYVGSQDADPSDTPVGVNEYPSVGVLWDGKADPSTWFYNTDYCEVGIQAIARVPPLLTTLHDAQWATRMAVYFTNPQRPSADWHIWTIPPAQANWLSILLPLLSRMYPAGARVVWSDPRTFFDSGNTRGTILFSILYSQAADYEGQIEGTYEKLARASVGFPPPSGFPKFAAKEYAQLNNETGPIAAFSEDLESLPPKASLISEIVDNCAVMGLNPNDFPTPRSWDEEAASYDEQRQQFTDSYNNQVNITSGVPAEKALSMWQDFAAAWGLPVLNSVDAIQQECTERIAMLGDFFGMCVENASAMRLMVERGSLNSCLDLLALLSNQLNALSKSPSSTLWELQSWAGKVLSSPNFDDSYPYLDANSTGKSCVIDFCSYSKIPVPSRFQLERRWPRER